MLCKEKFQSSIFSIFRGILDSASTLVKQRALQWDMGIIYPGLQLRVGPTFDANGVLEFALDPNVATDERAYLYEEKSTGECFILGFIVP